MINLWYLFLEITSFTKISTVSKNPNCLSFLHVSLFTMNGKRLSVEIRSEIATLYGTKTMSMKDLNIKYKVSNSMIHQIVQKKKLYGTVADRPKNWPFQNFYKS